MLQNSICLKSRNKQNRESNSESRGLVTDHWPQATSHRTRWRRQNRRRGQGSSDSAGRLSPTLALSHWPESSSWQLNGGGYPHSCTSLEFQSSRQRCFLNGGAPASRPATAWKPWRGILKLTMAKPSGSVNAWGRLGFKALAFSTWPESTFYLERTRRNVNPPSSWMVYWFPSSRHTECFLKLSIC